MWRVSLSSVGSLLGFAPVIGFGQQCGVQDIDLTDAANSSARGFLMTCSRCCVMSRRCTGNHFPTSFPGTTTRAFGCSLADDDVQAANRDVELFCAVRRPTTEHPARDAGNDAGQHGRPRSHAPAPPDQRRFHAPHGGTTRGPHPGVGDLDYRASPRARHVRLRARRRIPAPDAHDRRHRRYPDR